MKKKALKLLEAATRTTTSIPPTERNLWALLAIGYAILALVEVCEEKK